MFCFFLYISLRFLSVITDRAGSSGLWVGLAQSMPNLECVFWTMAFVSSLQSSRQNKPKQQVVAHLDELLTTPPPGNGPTWWRRRTRALEPGRADGMPNLVSCCLCDLGQATDPPFSHFPTSKKWECYHLSALGMKSQRGHSVQQMLAFNICPQGGLGGEYDWLLPLAHISFNFASLLPMS